LVAPAARRISGRPPRISPLRSSSSIVTREEAIGKYRAAVEVRDRQDPDFVIVARRLHPRAARVASARAARVQLLLVVQVELRRQSFRFQELGDLGYKFIFITLCAAHAGMHAVWNAMEDLDQNQEQARWALERPKAGHPTESHHVMARVSHFQELERKYIPDAAARIESSDGFGEGH